MQASYATVYDAYLRIFDRLGLDVFPVEAESGAIGGDVNHEFMVPSSVGEDHFVRCVACGYAANVEAAGRGGFGDPVPPDASAPAAVEHHTPDRPGIDAVVAFFDDPAVSHADLLKSLAVVDGDGDAVLVLVPGDREARLPGGWRLFEDADFATHPSLVKGYIGPGGQQVAGIRVVADVGVARPGPWITGANRADHHVSGALLGRDFDVDGWGSYAEVVTGDACPRCGAEVDLVRSVEAAHTFQLGSKYSDVMPGASFVAEDGSESVFAMGCYGMGVSRLLSVVAEECHDDRGLVWPAALAPFQVHLAALGAGRSPEVAAAADALHDRLVAAGVEVLYDDRDVSPGVKFADADLLGIPIRLVVGGKGVARGIVEWRSRATGDEREVALDAPAEALLAP
jgi:prolyl-tRNA synthetase